MCTLRLNLVLFKTVPNPFSDYVIFNVYCLCIIQRSRYHNFAIILETFWDSTVLVYSGGAKHLYANLQLSKTIKTIVNLYSMTCCYA